MKIVILDRKTCGDGIDFSGFNQLGTVIMHDNLTDPEQIISACHEANVIVTNKSQLSTFIINRLPASVKLIALTATGYDNVDIHAARARGIKVCNVPGYGTNAVAQLTMLLILSCSVKFKQQLQIMQKDGWSREQSLSLTMHELHGKTLGIIGLGAIGSKLANLAQAFDMQVIAYNRSPKHLPGVKQVRLEQLAPQADFVALCCALTPETTQLINHNFLAQMKKNAYLINTARGGLIDEEALLQALKQQQIAGAALDVLCQEPAPSDHPLLALDNVIITPHIAWAPIEARQRCIDIVESNITSFSYGEPVNIVN